MSGQGGRLSREELKKKKAIDDARKSGQLPPEVDSDGNLINPHIPEFMSKVPFYLREQQDTDETTTLRHQKVSKDKHQGLGEDDGWYKRGKDVFVKESSRAKKRKKKAKGGCKNCGALTHDAKNCMERPRKRGAVWTGKDIASDEIKQKKLELSFDASRDRWNGYDPDEHLKKTVSLHKKVEIEKKKKLMEEKKKKKQDGEDSSDESDSDDVLGIKQKESQLKASVRNREDVAKYLLNLDPDSAYYDPKTRSMRANPNPDVDPSQAVFAGDNFLRVSGDTVDMAASQLFAWEESKRGSGDAHLQANPTAVMLAHKNFKTAQEKIKAEKKKTLDEKYGKQEVPDKKLLPSATMVEEQYVEYTADGRIKNPGSALKSGTHVPKYAEDVLEGNHTRVWGSYFDRNNMQFGYACCYQTVRNSYCTGASGRIAKMESVVVNATEQPREMLESGKGMTPPSQTTVDPKEKEMEEYNRSKIRPGDPMAKP